MAENQETKTKRDLLGERLKTKYPDREYQDDEALFSQINDDYDEYERQLGTHRDQEKQLSDMMSKYPHSARFISDMASGVNPWVAIVEQLGMEGITDLFENPEYKDELAKAQAEYQKKLSRGQELEQEYNQNLTESLALLSQMQEQEGISDQEIDDAVDLLMKIANEALLGKFTRESLEMARKALGHEGDMEKARMEGEVAGRNAKIEQRLRRPQAGDGMPQLAGSNNAPSRKGSGSLFELAQEA